MSRAQADLEAARGQQHLLRARLDGNDGTRLPWVNTTVTRTDLVGLIGDLLDGCELVQAPGRAARGAVMGRTRWEVGQGVSVEVDGSTMPDPDESAQLPLLVVTVRLPGFRAHSLAHALLDHHRIYEITEAGGPWAVDWGELANTLHEAAETARAGEAVMCHTMSRGTK